MQTAILKRFWQQGRKKGGGADRVGGGVVENKGEGDREQ